MVALVSGPASAQVQSGSFRIGPRFGYIKYDDDTAIREAAMLGLDAMFNINSNIAIGFLLDVARPQTEGEFFPSELTFGDTTQVMGASQPITVLQYMGVLELNTGGKFSLFANGAVGGYRLSLDPQVNGGLEDFAELAFAVGGGIALSTSGATMVRLEVKDFIHTDFDREVLNPVADVFQPRRFPDVLPTPAPFLGTAHNIHVGLSFSFTPGG